jgi:hypothetical protein
MHFRLVSTVLNQVIWLSSLRGNVCQLLLPDGHAQLHATEVYLACIVFVLEKTHNVTGIIGLCCAL